MLKSVKKPAFGNATPATAMESRESRRANKDAELSQVRSENCGSERGFSLTLDCQVESLQS